MRCSVDIVSHFKKKLSKLVDNFFDPADRQTNTQKVETKQRCQLEDVINVFFFFQFDDVGFSSTYM